MADYYMDSNGNITRKKKEKKPSGKSYYMDIDGNITLLEKQIDQELAPVKTTKKEDDSKIQLFKKSGFFEDGYQFGDILKTIDATASHLATAAVHGVGSMAEGVLDLGGHLIAGGADLLGADKFADDFRKIINKDLVGAAADWYTDKKVLFGGGTTVEEGSILGRTGYGVGQAIGQIGGIIATGNIGAAANLGTAGASALTTGTMFASSAGSGISEAYNAGASDEEAFVYGAIKGGIDAGTELIFGGMGKGFKALGFSHGLSSADDILAKKLSSKIASRALKTLAQGTVKAGAEGLEEVLAGLGTAAAKMIYEDGVSYRELLEDENLLEQFVVGSLASGLSQSGSIRKSVKSDTDYISGLNTNEESVVQKEYEKRLAAEEKDGKTLTKKEQNAIYEQVVSDMDKGYISIDTIEEVLGGDSFKAYQDAANSEKALKEEYDKLANTPKGELTHIQEKRLAELEKQIEGEPKSTALKLQLSETVRSLAQGSRLAESYNEKEVRSKQKFQADVSQYEGLAKESIQKIMDKGQVQNTNRAHDFFDLAVKAAAGRGRTVSTMDTQEILAKITELHGEDYVRKNFYTEVTKDGKTEWKLTRIPDAVVDGNEIVLNVESSKLTRALLGHEVWHTFKGTKYESRITQLINSYAQTVKGKDKYGALKSGKGEAYQNILGADAQTELTGDLIGEYIFSDEAFVKHLTQDRNVFQKIFDEIKYMLKMVTTGSEQERDLLRIKRTFEKAWRESQGEKNTTTEGDVEYAIESKTQPGKLDPRTVTKKDVADLLHKVEEGTISGDTYFPVRINTPATLIYWAKQRRGDVIDNKPIAMSAEKAYGAMTRQGETGTGRANRLSAEEIVSMVEAMNDPEYIVYQNVNDRYVEVVRFDTKAGDTAFAVIEIGNDKNAIHMNGFEGGLYNILVTTYPPKTGKLKELLNNPNNEVIYDKKKDVSQRSSSSIVPSLLNDTSFFEENVSQKGKNVKQDFSISSVEDDAYLDAVSRGDTEAAQKMVEEAAKNAGYSIKAYHGTRADFFTFDKGRVGKGTDQYGAGFYFAGDKEAASHYGNRVISSALKLENPYSVSAVNLLDAEITLTESQAYKIVKKHPMMYDTEESPLGDYYDAYWENGPKEWMVKDLAAQYTDLGLLDSDLFRDYPNELHEAVREVTGHDGIVVNLQNGEKFYIAWFDNQMKSADPVTYDDNGNAIPLSERFKPDEADIRYSLSNTNAEYAPSGNDVPMRELRYVEEAAPVQEAAAATKNVQTEAEMFPDDFAPIADDTQERLWSLTDEDAPAEVEAPYTEDIEPSTTYKPFDGRDELEVGKRNVKAFMVENPEVRPYFQEAAGIMLGELENSIKGERIYIPQLHYDSNYEQGWTGTKRQTSDDIAYLLDSWHYTYKQIEDGLNAIIEGKGEENKAISKRIEFLLDERLRNGYKDVFTGYDVPPNAGYINLLNQMQNAEASSGQFDSLMEIADDIAPVRESRQDFEAEIPVENPPADRTKAPSANKPILTVKDRLEAKLQNLQNELAQLESRRQESLDDFEVEIEEIANRYESKSNKNTKAANDLLRRVARRETRKWDIDADYEKRINAVKEKIAQVEAEIKSGESPKEQRAMRAEVHEHIIDNIKTSFAEKGFDFDKVLEKAKDLSTFATVDNTPQRVLEKSLGYKEGQILADMTVNKVAENETKAIQWLNNVTDRKNGLLAQLVKEYNIKPRSKESAAAQMYAEGFYVNENEEIIEYGDKELAKDFPDAKVRENIKGLASDPRIREFYDSALASINESRARNAYPEIKPLKNYFLHFRAQNDTFSRLGIPFNPNDIKAKDLPTDLNGVTADLKPGQPYFASSMHRKGKRTDFDLLGGLEQYAVGASRQIFHIDDIQTLRALRNYVADTYGQGKGLENLDKMTEEEAEARIKEVYGAHLSTFAKFLNEEANVIAGKTSLVDRGLEGIIGRRGMTIMDSLNKQVGANMIGFNISSSLTNLIAPVQAFAKSNKAAFVKGIAQTASNRLKSIKGQSDGFMEQNPGAIRREGADRFSRTPWQKVSDAGYVFMSAIDSVSTELILRAKYNELTSKGMDSQQAHIEADKWASRILGDRSLGQQPQIYNSKMLGMITKFQLEVRNQLDSQFYDTIQEAKLSNEDITNRQERNAKTAAKVTKTFVELAVLQHLFGKAFEAVAGYNPAFDIISALIKAFGLDDDEDDEDTFTDNLWEGAQELLGDLPYTSVLTGGRIPIASALPVEQLITGKDQYGNEKSRWETLKETVPYYVMPGGYGQLKKTTQGLSMFSDEHPVAGSYTDSGNLRFPVAPTAANIAQAAVFGQYASKNAREYFDNDYAPLKEKQIQEFIDLDIPIKEYREIRGELADKDTLGEKVAYIATLDLPVDKKNILVNNAANREEPIDMTNYGEYDDWGEFEYAHKYPEKYAFLQANGISAKDYAAFDDDTKEAWSWAYQNPEKFTLSKAISGDVTQYRQYTKALSDITADKNQYGKTISGSRKDKVAAYINSIDADYGEKIILFKSEYPSDNTYNYEIVEYLNSREDISYDDMMTILYELGFTVKNGRAYW